MLYPVLRYLIPPKVPGAHLGTVQAAKAAELRPGSGKLFRFGSSLGILVRTPSGEFRAFNSQCTHLACTVQYRADLEHIWCACHNGHYDLYGKNIAGPPPRPLEQYDVSVRGEDVFVSRKA
ncbi:MAG: Rieske 2Fe-2S domain-containing protein [Candidatus Tectomicrobia bacterium]|nr:Rieske 2Fe-2S domain-containing protein [Candidatus Tectomicrobia bacterium]